MIPAQPIVSSALYDAITAFAWPVLILTLWVVHLVEKRIRARRNEKQIAAEKAMRRGMKEANRRGWIPEDLQ